MRLPALNLRLVFLMLAMNAVTNAAIAVTNAAPVSPFLGPFGPMRAIHAKSVLNRNTLILNPQLKLKRKV